MGRINQAAWFTTLSLEVPMKLSVFSLRAAASLLATSFLGCSAVSEVTDAKSNDKANVAIGEPSSKPAPQGEMSLTVAGGTLRDARETLTVIVEDASGKKHEKVISSAKKSTLAFSGLSAGPAKVSAQLQGSETGDLEGSGEVEIVAGKRAKLALSLVPSEEGGLDIVIERPPDSPVDDQWIAPIKPNPKSLLKLAAVPKNETFTFRSRSDSFVAGCNGFKAIITFKSSGVSVEEWGCEGSTSSKGPNPDDQYTRVAFFQLAKPKSVVGLVDLLNRVERQREEGVSSKMACVIDPGVATLKLARTGDTKIKPKEYADLGANNCPQDGDFAQKQALDVLAAIYRFAKANNEPVAPTKPGPKSLLKIAAVPDYEVFTFRSSVENSRIRCNGFETVITFKSGQVGVAERGCGGAVESQTNNASDPYTDSAFYFLAKPKSVAGLVELLNRIERQREAGVSSMMACLLNPGTVTFKLTRMGASREKPKVYSGLGANNCPQDGDFAEKQARDVHTAILKFAKEKNEFDPENLPGELLRPGAAAQ
jgi:hypothetical protein